MNLRRNAVLVLVVATLAVTSATPSFATRNDHRFAKSIEGNKLAREDSMCAGLKKDLDKAEREADKRAGTKAAKAWSDRADGVWAMGVAKGCSWAA